MPNRSELIEEKIDDPLSDLRDAAEVAAMVEFEAVRLDAIAYYFDRFLQGFLAEAVEDALRGKKLERLSPDDTRQAGFLLLADFMTQLGNRLVTPSFAKAQPKWLGQFLRRIAKLGNLSHPPLVRLALKGSLDSVLNHPVVAKLSDTLGVSLEKVLVLQPLMIENVIDEVLSPPKRKKAAKKPAKKKSAKTKAKKRP